MKRIFIALLLECLTAFLAHLNAQTTGWNYNATSEKADAKPAKQTYKKLPRNARKQFDGMTFVPAGTFVMNRLEHYITATANDTCLLLGNVPRRVSVDAYFISNHEVSNSEYRAFTSWVTMRTAMDILASHYPERCLPNGHYNEAIPVDWNDSLLNGSLYFADEQRFIYKNMLNTDKLIYNYPDADTGMIGIPIYPDTLCWVDDFRYSYNEPFSRLYFQHPAYDNYPVAGVSWNQAMAYCQWRTDRLNEDILVSKKILRQKSYYFSTQAFLADSANSNYARYLYPSFRLPTEAEWEYAALEVDPKTNKQSVYPWWGSALYNNKGQWLANTGPIFDANGVCFKSYTDDGASLTAPVLSYFPNSKGLFNMAGNMAEWVLDGSQSARNDFGITADDNYSSAFVKVATSLATQGDYMLDTLNQADRNQVQIIAGDVLHNAITAERFAPARMVKGGSWCHSAVYMLSGTRCLVNENRQSSWIGFRVAMTNVGAGY